MQTIIPRVERLSKVLDINKPEMERMEHIKEIVGICNFIITRHEARDTYNGEVILSLLSLIMCCRSTIKKKAIFIAWLNRYK
jgi:hypothetical protein